MTTMEHDVSDLHRAYLLYIMPVGKVYTGFSLLWGGGWESPHTNQKIAYLPFHHQIFIPSNQKSIQFNKKLKPSVLAVVIALVPFLF